MFSLDIQLVTLILFIALFLLISGKISVDKTAMGILVALSITGILSPKETVAGFSNPAVLTVGAMFLLSRGLMRTGAVGFISHLVLAMSKANKKMAFLLILITVGLSSAFINNTPVVILFIPIVMALSCQCDFSPSTLLIPMSYVSILAGTCTLIGTSTNLIVSDLSTVYGFAPLSMFELAKVGVPIALAGLGFLLVFSGPVMPGRRGPVCELNETSEKRYLAELIVSEQNPLIGDENFMDQVASAYGLEIIEIFRKGNIIDPVRTPTTLEEADILLVKGSAEDLVSCLKRKLFLPALGEENLHPGTELKDDLIIELIVPPMSSLRQERLHSTELKDDPEIQIIAIRTRKTHYTHRKIRSVRLKIGDIILVRCPRYKLDKIRQSMEFIILEDVHHALIDKEKAKLAITIFSGVVLAATFGLAGIMTCAFAGVFLMTLTHCLTLKDAYNALEPDVLLLIIATIALGSAMEKTGATTLYAGLFLDLFRGMEPGVILSAIILLASISTHILSNNATAVLLLPIAASTATSLGVNPKPFIMGICFGASACFATPIGYQTNLLVYGPGGYRFSDFLKLGLPLSLIVVLLASLFIPLAWPF
ncbi:MAG: SLC13 family permease [Desulfobacter postgatei]|uniref:SLC13 family permease n=1 Tax=Desulfobacter postgatei TaxID=2293 RepID=A0A2G6MSX4_9BACT|nr:MAG: SLC13 family permease [Desulfobacter postgatei]